MLDTEESGYEPSKRSRNWLKVLYYAATPRKDQLANSVIGQKGLS